MPTIGSREVNLHTTDRDETVYAYAGNSVSHADVVALRRTLPAKPGQPLRTNVRFERGFQVDAATGLEKPVTVSIAMTVPPGANVDAVRTAVKLAIEDAAVTAAELAVTGDIHL